MFKNYINILSTPLIYLFIVNNTRHEYFTRQHNDLHVDIGLKDGVYNLFSFHGIYIWNHINQYNQNYIILSGISLYLLGIHCCEHFPVSFLSYIQISDFDLNIS